MARVAAGRAKARADAETSARAPEPKLPLKSERVLPPGLPPEPEPKLLLKQQAELLLNS